MVWQETDGSDKAKIEVKHNGDSRMSSLWDVLRDNMAETQLNSLILINYLNSRADTVKMTYRKHFLIAIDQKLMSIFMLL